MRELQLLAKELYTEGRTSVSPESFMYTMWNAMPLFYGHNQHDAQEFLRFFVERLRVELSKEGDSDPFVTRVFRGSVRSQVKCSTCSAVSEVEEPFLDLSLDIPSTVEDDMVETAPSTPPCTVASCPPTTAQSEVAEGESKEVEAVNKEKEGKEAGQSAQQGTPAPASAPAPSPSPSPAVISRTEPVPLLHCLKYFTGAEELSAGEHYDCPRCGSHQPATKHLVLHKLPQVLCLHLKRFVFDEERHTFRKRICPIIIPTTLTTKDVGAKSGRGFVYKLVAVINHLGSTMQGGHYTANCYNAWSDKWVTYDDSRVGECTAISEQQAYVVFYERKSKNLQ